MIHESKVVSSLPITFLIAKNAVFPFGHFAPFLTVAHWFRNTWNGEIGWQRDIDKFGQEWIVF